MCREEYEVQEDKPFLYLVTFLEGAASVPLQLPQILQPGQGAQRLRQAEPGRSGNLPELKMAAACDDGGHQNILSAACQGSEDDGGGGNGSDGVGGASPDQICAFDQAFLCGTRGQICS